MPFTAPDKSIPVRFVVRGSTVYNDTDAGKKHFTAIGDVVEYNPSVPDPSLVQVNISLQFQTSL